MSVNKVTLIGNLGRDPEVRYSQSGSPIANLSVATTRKWRNKQTNEMNEETEWHRVSVFGQQAEACGKYLAKGRMVYVDGRIQSRSYEDKEGVKRTSVEIVANDVQFLGGKGERQERPSDGPEPYDPGNYSPKGIDDDMIPF